MGHILFEAVEHTIEDSITLIPFLIITYLIMEAVERATAGKVATALRKAGPAGPAVGAAFGVFPQCGFSAAAGNFYSGGLISLGTLIAVFMSTSDEMLPVFIAEKVPAGTIIKILGTKVIIAIITGYTIYFLSRRIFQREKEELKRHREEHGHDCSEEGRSLIVEALIRSAKTFGFIFVISFILNLIIHSVGEELLESVLRDTPVLGEVVAAAVGLIPNCASSILISQLYLAEVISPGAMISGLLVSAGVGILVLFEENHNLKENLLIVLLLYIVSVAWGLIIQGLGIVF
ncbi:MAG: arsenic efflux protein [Firmicutes bacterium]|nr:arsenic efflux protein [Bacillota bacterium]